MWTVNLGQIARLVSSVFDVAGVRPTLVTVLAIYVLIVSLHGLLLRWQIAVSLGLRHGFVGHLRGRLYRAITHTDWVFFSRSRSSDYVHLLTIGMSRVGEATF